MSVITIFLSVVQSIFLDRVFSLTKLYCFNVRGSIKIRIVFINNHNLQINLRNQINFNDMQSLNPFNGTVLSLPDFKNNMFMSSRSTAHYIDHAQSLLPFTSQFKMELYHLASYLLIFGQNYVSSLKFSIFLPCVFQLTVTNTLHYRRRYLFF